MMQSDYSAETTAAFRTIRKITLVALGVAFVHVVFGAIVRISGSGMGCGDHWPKCYGSFFPPMDRPDLIIEVSHRYLA
ncbi:MAG: COX15/CtaA family protein, partial [Gemmatimonadaceae bacterium]